MGMDVYGNKGGSFSYNWGGWRGLIRRLNAAGVDTSEFSGANDGEPISEATCLAAADVLERSKGEKRPANLADLSELEDLGVVPLGSTADALIDDHRSSNWLDEQIAFWRNCGGCEQW